MQHHLCSLFALTESSSSWAFPWPGQEQERSKEKRNHSSSCTAGAKPVPKLGPSPHPHPEAAARLLKQSINLKTHNGKEGNAVCRGSWAMEQTLSRTSLCQEKSWRVTGEVAASSKASAKRFSSAISWYSQPDLNITHSTAAQHKVPVWSAELLNDNLNLTHPDGTKHWWKRGRHCALINSDFGAVLSRGYLLFMFISSFTGAWHSAEVSCSHLGSNVSEHSKTHSSFIIT